MNKKKKKMKNKKKPWMLADSLESVCHRETNCNSTTIVSVPSGMYHIYSCA